MRVRRAEVFVVVAAVSTVAVAGVTFSASAEPTYVSQLSFAKADPAYDPVGAGTRIVGDVSVTGAGYLDFFGRSVVQTPDRPELNPGVADFAFGARIALTRGVSDWNIMQKGYWSDDQWKLSTHGTGGAARLSCRFSGSRGAVHVFTQNQVVPTDGSWHDVACVRAGDTVRVEVDGKVAAQGSGPIGSIVSTKPYLIGSKGMDMADPDQYLGLLDDAYVIRDDNPPPPPPVNHPPNASLKVVSCDQLECLFDASRSTDPDGDALQYSWDFGDGSMGSDAEVTHRFDTDGTYPVKVTVRDPTGAAASASASVKVSTVEPEVGFRAASGAVADAKAISVTVPTSVRAGDALLLFVTANKSAVALKPPSGWQSLGRQTDDSMQTALWRREANTADAGSSLQVAAGSSTTMTANLLAYSSTGATPPSITAFSSAEEHKTTAHTTPVAAATSDDWVVSMWADRSAETAWWQPPAAVVVRQFLATTGSGHVTSLVADSGGEVGGGSAGGLTASASAASYVATTWTVVLTPG